MKELTTTAVTMTSLEMVKFINDSRKEGAAVLQHKSFMAKVPKVLKEDAQKFLLIYKDSMNREQSCYSFPKREACLMAMSYSYELQAKVFDRMTELEAQQPQLPTTYLAALEKLVETEREKQSALAENAKLNTIIDNEFGYSSILRAAAYAGVHEKTFNWRPLKAMTMKLGLEIKRVPSPRYGYQNLYPIRAFEAVYPDIDFDDLKPELVPDKYKLALIS